MIFNGVINVLAGRPWEDDFDLTPKALPRSFVAIFAYIPCCFIVAAAAAKYNDARGHVPYSSIALILLLVSLSFPFIAYVLCSLFEKPQFYRPWVIVRNWAMLSAWMVIGIAFGLYLLGIFPFSVAFFVGMTTYLGTLAMDVRLAGRIAEFDWAGAVFAGVLISVSSMMVLLVGLTQVLS